MIFKENQTNKQTQNHTQNFRKEESFGVSKYNKTCRKLFGGHVIFCLITSSFFVPFTETFRQLLQIRGC